MSATNVAHAGKRGNICVGNNVSSFARALTHKLNRSVHGHEWKRNGKLNIANFSL